VSFMIDDQSTGYDWACTLGKATKPAKVVHKIIAIASSKLVYKLFIAVLGKCCVVLKFSL